MTIPQEDPESISESAVLRSLGDLDQRLLQVLEIYLENCGTGQVVNHEEFIAQHPDVATQLPDLLASIDALEGLSPESSLESHDGTMSAVGWKDLACKTVGDYRVLREIGRGGMGIVYEAQQISLDRRVALKVLPLTVVLDEQQISRFMIEAQAAAQLHHPNIVPIFSVGQEDGVHCYSMPLIDGVSLDRRIAEMAKSGSSSTNWRDAITTSVQLVIQAARALDHAHDRGVIHRDIKPSNLLVDHADKLWVTDFGLARCRQDSSLTQSGAIVGTLRYMSPEQASGKPQSVDHRSDIYSLGITLYELVTGQPAFAEASRAALLAQRQYSQPRAPRRVNHRLARDLETILLKSIANDPAQRYQNAGEMADDLQRYLEGKPVLARRPSVADRLTKWTARYRKTVAAAALLLIIGLVGSLVATTKLQNALDVADANLEQSNENFRRTREVLDHFGLLAAERLRGVAGAESIREQLVRDLLKYYEEFAVTASSDPDLREDLARTHFRAARIIEELGGRERALIAYQRAGDLFSTLAQETKASEARNNLRFHFGLCRNNMALLLAESGEHSQAEQLYRHAMEIQAELNDVHPQACRELASVHGNFGLLLAATDRIAAAETELLTSLSLLESLDQSRSAADEIQLAKATTLNNLGYLFQESDQERSLDYNGRAIEILRRNVGVDGAPAPTFIRPLATSLNNQAALMAKQDRLFDALELYREALTIYRDLVEQAPLVTQYSEELAITYNNFGRLLTRAGNHSDARMSLERARDLLQLLLRRRPDEPRYSASLGGVLNNLAKVSMVSGDLDQAILEYQASIREQQKLQELNTEKRSYAEMLKTTYANFETALRESGRLLDAERIKSLRAAL